MSIILGGMGLLKKKGTFLNNSFIKYHNMKKLSFIAWALVTVAIGTYLMAADHIDAPAVGSLGSGSSLSDITDYYAFESPSNSNNYVFVCNVAGLSAPSATGALSFSDDLMYEFNIDNDGDNVEDLVIQAIFRGDRVIVRGPVAPSATGLASTVASTNLRVETTVSAYGATPVSATNGGVTAFAGPRDDPFFMDFFKFVDIVNGAGVALGLERPAPADGNAYATSFDVTGTDTFAGTNVMSVVVEVPKSMLGSNSTFSTWVESKSSL